MKTKKFAIIAALVLTASIGASGYFSANAEGTSYSSVLATETELNATVLEKYLVMKESANVPNVSFKFDVEAGNAIDADIENGKLAVMQGIVTSEIESSTITFSASDTTIAENEKNSTDTPVFVTSDITNDEKYVKKSLTLDFSKVPFTEPGVYRYLITETGINQGITNGYKDAENTETTKTLDVYVEDAGTTDEEGKPQLKIAGYVMYDGEVEKAPDASKTEEMDANEIAVKNNTITNVYASQNLTFGKIVTGNQGSKDKYFDFTVELKNVTPGTVYTVDISNADAKTKKNSATISENTEKENVTSFKIPENEKSFVQHFYLQNGQYITIQGLAEGTEYSITENSEDYKSEKGIIQTLSTLNWDGEEGLDALDDAVNGKIEDKDIHTGYVNDRSGAIPTGVLSTVAGSAGMVALGIAGITTGILFLKKRKSEE